MADYEGNWREHCRQLTGSFRLVIFHQVLMAALATRTVRTRPFSLINAAIRFLPAHQATVIL
jgi:hypothetical protein